MKKLLNFITNLFGVQNRSYKNAAKEAIPDHHGFVLVDPEADKILTAPIPFNIIVRMVLLFFYWAARPFRYFDDHYQVHLLSIRHREIQKSIHTRLVPQLEALYKTEENFDRKRQIGNIVSEARSHLK